MAASYTIEQIREAARRKGAREPAPQDADPELEQLASELAENAATIYRIGEGDLDAYLRQRQEYPCDQRMPAFREAARHYIDQCEGFGEQMGICFDLAYGDTADVACSCPAHDEEDGE